ncbi:hypothetical protein COU17_03540 [Candidatus Kaiserbacteria bacterium CG10_big_fil_rev_8_21_14_0_10_49_17]|uniref:LTD domain-containing protein n=1 Tax=Candidatus Kaiserbacteria bacterium CG10_big_fil_rev_8_21_14_0_10_49_17 TaxID=1974609 RepID=A0A2M6WDG5_9BACT|nr:MAG: hypothetical protein COU17_03540 [Candidatus Kaiserbacteria bacterium CG10_big_fil_rev_8_21_14_0_10_49_17]
MERGAAMADLLLLAGIIIVLGIAWVQTGGPGKEASSFFSAGAPIAGTLSPLEWSTGDGTEPQEKGQTVDEETVSLLEQKRIEAQSEGVASPYKGIVEITPSTAGPRNTNPQEEYLTLHVRSSATNAIDLTGWTLESMLSGKKVKIPKASTVSTSGTVNVEGPLVAKPDEEIILTTGRSPVGHSFKVNKCTGYFEQFQDFTPRLDEVCPSPENELIFADNPYQQFGNECLDYIEDMPACRMQVNAVPPQFPGICQYFIVEEINYTRCIYRHRSDADFFSLEWRVYLAHDKELWRSKREIIRLLDNNGRVVDVFSY